MYLLIGLFGLAFACTFWMGFKRLLQLKHLNRQRILNGFIAAMILLTLMTLGQWLEIVSQDTVAQFTMFLYSGIAGFFCGFATKMVLLRQEVQKTEYVYRSFWTQAAPNLIAILLILLGVYHSGLLTLGPYTGIGITSGLSLLGFGLFGLTIRIVPDFRQKGILILDQFVPWKNVVSYEWKSEQAIQIDYYTADKKLTDFTTYIPAEDRVVIEKLLGQKLKEYEQERRDTMNTENELR